MCLHGTKVPLANFRSSRLRYMLTRVDNIILLAAEDGVTRPGDRPRSIGRPAPIHPGTGPDPPVDRPRSTGGSAPIHRGTAPIHRGTGPIYRGTSSETSFHLSYTLCISTDDPYGPASPSHCRVPHGAHEAARRAGPSTGPRPNIVKRKLTDNEPFAGPRHSNRFV